VSLSTPVNHMGEIGTVNTDILSTEQLWLPVSYSVVPGGRGEVHDAEENVWKQVRGCNRVQNVP
jgi:hypothetical protein